MILQADLVDDEILELVELETRDLLSSHGFDGDNCPFIIGSATLAIKGDRSKYGVPAIQKLLDAMDNYLPTPERDFKSTFVIPMYSAFLDEEL